MPVKLPKIPTITALGTHKGDIMSRYGDKRKYNKKAGKSKDECQKLHFMKRMRERFGFLVNDALYNEMIDVITSGSHDGRGSCFTLRSVEKQSNRVTVFELLVDGSDKIVHVMYDNQRKSFATAVDPSEGRNIGHYYDVFNNKVSIKDKYYVCRVWIFKDGDLIIPESTVEKVGDEFHVTAGLVKGKKFIFEGDDLVEVF